MTVFILLVFASCSENKESKTEMYHLERKELHFLPIDNSTSVSTTQMVYLEENNKSLLYALNTEKQRIQIYDWVTKKIIRKIQLEKEGPNGVGTANSICLNNIDSLYILSTYSYRLSLLNNKGKLLKKYILLEDDTKFDSVSLTRPQGKYSVLTIGNTANPLFKYNEKIIAGAFPNLDFKREEYFKDGKFGLCFNTKTNHIDYVMKYPKIYLDNFRNGYRFPGQFTWSSLAFNKNKNISITSFPIDENIYTINMQNYSVSTYPAGSKFIETVNLLSKNPSNPNDEFDFAVNNDCYDAVHYDPYHNIYLRYALHPNPKKKDQYDGHSWLLRSVILLDENFNRLGESMLDENTSGATFFRKDGIYMQQYNPNVEDKLTFVRYELSKN